MKDSKNLVIGMLCAVLCIMAVAYAAFTTTLNINGSANISSNWSVIIPASDGISCTTQAAAGGSEEGLSASGTADGGTSATFTMSFVQPGDSATCTVKIKNAGTLNAKVSDVQITGNEATGAIRFSVQGIDNTKKLAAAGEMTFTVTGTYDASTSTQPGAGDKTKSLTVTPIFVQDMDAGA